MYIGKIGSLGLFLSAAVLGMSLAQAAPPPGVPPVGGGLADRVAELEATVAALEARLADIEDNSVLALDGALTYDVSAMTARFSGVNVQVVNGVGSTDSINGLGNLIVGYDAPRILGISDKIGSHNMVIGDEHNYNRYGGLVAGLRNAITGDWASVSGGWSNEASGFQSNVNGGRANKASGTRSSVSGGAQSTASGEESSVSGGFANKASGVQSSVSGGELNEAIGRYSSVSGGALNKAIDEVSSVSGGFRNEASGRSSSVSGGFENTASGTRSSVSGGTSNDASGFASSILGGEDQSTLVPYGTIPTIP